jgi:sarcosine oxidase
MARQRLVTADPRSSAALPALPARAEFVIVGAGVTGLAAAWALNRRGREVIVLDQAPVGHSGGGSHGSCRIFRRGYDDAFYVTLAGQARAPWTELEEASGERLLEPTPQLTFGPQMPLVLAAMTAAGAACELIPQQEAAARYPGVAVTGETLVELESAVIAADKALACLAGLAGPPETVRTGVRVSALADDGRRVRVTTPAGDIDAAAVIVCAGPGTARLLATAGISVPGSATLEQVAYLEPAGAPAAPEMPIFVHYSPDFAYGLPVPGTRRYKIGIHHSGPPADPDHQDEQADEELSARIEDAARRFLPWYVPRAVLQERCIYDNSPDGDFVIDRSGNIVVGSGTSGHGFKFGPMIGEWLADLAVGSTSPGVRFALGRF